MANDEKELDIPIWLKTNLTVEEAAYTGIGMNKLRELSDSDSCDFVLWIGRKRLLKRKNLRSSSKTHFLYRCVKGAIFSIAPLSYHLKKSILWTQQIQRSDADE